MKKGLLLLLLVLLAGVSAQAEPLRFDRSRARPLASWKPQITRYSEVHYGESTWELHPTCIVLHYTAMPSFPWNLVRETSFKGETPGLACHYVIDGDKVWEILPPNVRSRGAYGINHRAINIEMMALDSDDLAAKAKTLETCRKLCQQLMADHGIDKSHIYSHQQVATMNRKVVPEVLDLVNSAPYHKIDPGEANMTTILSGIRE
jgi:N-acetyl-anhydromuramyl-L-alanine amidase AmpD